MGEYSCGGNGSSSSQARRCLRRRTANWSLLLELGDSWERVLQSWIIYLLTAWIQQIADQHFQTDDHPPALFLAPSAYANITCAPIKGYYTERFFMAPKGASFANHYFGPSGQTGVVAFVLTTFRALLMFRSTPRACVLVTVLGVVCGFFIAYLLNAKKEIDHVNGSKTTLGYTYEGVTAGVYVSTSEFASASSSMYKRGNTHYLPYN